MAIVAAGRLDRGVVTAFALEADIPAFLRIGALEAPGGQLANGFMPAGGADFPEESPSRGAPNCPGASAPKSPDSADRGPHVFAESVGYAPRAGRPVSF